MAELMPDSSADPDAILADFLHFTARWHELDQPLWLEVRTFGEHLQPLNSRFRPDAHGLQLAADFVASMNALNRNAYAVRNPIRDDAPPSASDEHIAAAFYLWADCDDGQAAENVKRFGDARCTAVVRTGTAPSERVHTYWELAEPVRDLGAWRSVQEAIAARFGSDRTVVNASRIMRIAGTVAWPNAQKRAKGYVPEMAKLFLPANRAAMPFERAQRVWPAATPPVVTAAAGTPQATSAPGMFATAAPGLDRERTRIQALAGQEWHNAVIKLVASYVAKGLADAEVHALTDPLTLPGYSIEQTRREVQTAIDGARRKGWTPAPEHAPPQTEPRADDDPSPLQPFTGASLAGLAVPSRIWHVDGLIPSRTVTMLGGDGGTGKSLLALQLAAATASGQKWLGFETCAGPALFISAEDERDELHRRLADIAQAGALDLGELDHLHLASLAGEDALLAVVDRRSDTLVATTLFAEVEALAEAIAPTVIVFDTLADLFGGDENRRGQARQFIGMLRGLAMRCDCAVALLAHPSLSGLSNGSGSSGSTAWNGSVRSRLYLERIADEGFEPNPDARRLVTKKANYGRTGGEIVMRWEAGVFVAETKEPEGALDRMASNAKAERVFLAMLRKVTEQGRYVSASPSSPTYAPTFFAKAGAEGCTRQVLRAAMEALFASGRIVVATHGPASSQRSHIALSDG